eukprot:COSAG01_NODE_73978_length_231_cov_28.257576_1_plen_77_part_11
MSTPHQRFALIRLREFLLGVQDRQLVQLHSQMQAMDTSPHKAMYSQFLQPVVPLNVTSFLREYALHMEYLEYEFEDP